jgi:HD-like signal output (HDOD) protein
MTVPAAFKENITVMLKKRIADGNLALPALPDVVGAAEKILNDKEYDLDKISTLIERDPMLTAQLFSLANSGTKQQRAESVRQAITHLGPINTRKFLATATSHRLFFSRIPRVNDKLNILWNHAIAVAVYSQDIAGLTQAGEPEAAYAAGLLHDIGQIVVAIFLFEVERSIILREPKAGGSWLSLEDWIDVIKSLHRSISTMIAERWNLPRLVCEAIEKCDDYNPGDRNSIVNIVRFSDALADYNGLSITLVDQAQNTAFLMIGRSLLSLDEDVVKRLSALAQTMISKAS